MQLRENKNERGDLEHPQPGNCGGQTLTQNPSLPHNPYSFAFEQAAFRSAENAHNFDNSENSDSEKIDSLSTKSCDTSTDATNDEEEYRQTLELKRELRETRRASKKGLYLGNTECDLERNLIDSSPAPATSPCHMIEDNPKKGLYYFILHTLLMSANCYAAAAIFSLNPNVSVI